MCGCGCLDNCVGVFNCVGVLLIIVLIFTVFRIVCTAFLLFRLCIFILIVLPALVLGLLPQNENSTAVSNNNINNNKFIHSFQTLFKTVP
jgi:hypothetical protein